MPGARPLLAALCLLGLSSLLACADRPRPNVLMILIDTLRADHLGAYGHPRSLSPNIDALAEEGTLFESAISQSSWTGPAVASLFTSLYPSEHGMVRFGDSLREDLPTLAEALRDAGYRTLAVSANFAFVNARKGMLRGFERKSELSRPSRPGERAEMLGINAVTGRVVSDRAIELLAKEDDRPFFLYVHYMDPHSNYDPPIHHRDAATRSYTGPIDGSSEQLREIVRGEIAIDDRDLAQLRRLYEGEVASVDAEVGRLLDHLREAGIYDETLVVLLSDHGEELFDHRSLFHMFTLYREQIHVPLVIRSPRAEWTDARVSRVVELIDVGPTILELVGLRDERPTEGSSLAGLVEGSGDPEAAGSGFSELHEDPVVTSAWRAKRHRRALTTDRWSLLEGPRRGAFELYDRLRDPAQQADRRTRESSTMEELARRLSAQRTTVWEAPAEQRLDDREIEELRALGYVD